MRTARMFQGVLLRARTIPLFAVRPSLRSGALTGQSASAHSAGQGRLPAGARAFPLTEASTVAGCCPHGVGTPVRLALSLLFVFAVAATYPAIASAQTAPADRASPVDPYAGFIVEASQRFGIPAAWIRAVMRVESAGDVRAISPKGAMGLMQIMPDTGAELRARHRLGSNPYDPRDNIFAGAAYLRELHDFYGSPGFLAAYNAGPGRYQEYLAGRPLPAETRAYVATLASLIGSGEIVRPVMVATADPLSWTRAPLFVEQSVSTSAAIPTPSEQHRDDGRAATPVRAAAANTVPSDGLFVARSSGRTPQ